MKPLLVIRASLISMFYLLLTTMPVFAHRHVNEDFCDEHYGPSCTTGGDETFWAIVIGIVSIVSGIYLSRGVVPKLRVLLKIDTDSDSDEEARRVRNFDTFHFWYEVVVGVAGGPLMILFGVVLLSGWGRS